MLVYGLYGYQNARYNDKRKLCIHITAEEPVQIMYDFVVVLKQTSRDLDVSIDVAKRLVLSRNPREEFERRLIHRPSCPQPSHSGG